MEGWKRLSENSSLMLKQANMILKPLKMIFLTDCSAIFNTLLNKEIVKISESAVENAKKQYDRAKITTQVGTTAQTVLAEAEAALAREKQNLKTAEVNVGRSLFAFAQLLQLSDYKDFDVENVDVPEALDSQLVTADEVLTKAYDVQPQIKAAESRIRSAEAQTEVSKQLSGLH
jgi:outer membrane protein